MVFMIWLYHMKTTIEIPDSLFHQARTIAIKKQLSFKELVTSALRQFLASQHSSKQSFQLKDGSIKGKGLQPGFVEGDWGEIRQMIYEGRGG